MAARVFRMITIAKDLREYFPGDITKVRIFNFTEGQVDLPVESAEYKKLVGTMENVWVRVYDSTNRYYDFVSSSIYFDANDQGLFILAAEDTEFIAVSKISAMVRDYLTELRERNLPVERYLNTYATAVLKEISAATRELKQLHSVVRISAFSRLDIEDTFEYGRDKLMRRYLLNLIASKVIKENREAVLELLN